MYDIYGIVKVEKYSNKIVTLVGKRSFVPNFDGPEILGPKNFPMLDGGGAIPHLLQLLILNSEMKDLH